MFLLSSQKYHRYLFRGLPKLSFELLLGVEPVIDSSVETCTVASGYTIVKHENNFYCLKQGQTLEERMQEKARMILKPSELSQLRGQEAGQAGLQQAEQVVGGGNEPSASPHSRIPIHDAADGQAASQTDEQTGARKNSNSSMHSQPRN